MARKIRIWLQHGVSAVEAAAFTNRIWNEGGLFNSLHSQGGRAPSEDNVLSFAVEKLVG
jgi:hypothetical protein